MRKLKKNHKTLKRNKKAYTTWDENDMESLDESEKGGRIKHLSYENKE